MDAELILFICDSRGRGLDKFLRNSLSMNFKVLTYSGAGIYESVHRAANHIKSERWSQIYLLAGICSVTIKDPISKIVSLRIVDQAALLKQLEMEISHSIDFVSMIIEDKNVRCVVAPITGMDLRKYNQGQTAASSDTHQSILNDSIVEINKYIVSVNSANNIVTPWVSRYIHKRARNDICHHYHKLSNDGCHLTDELRMLWADALSVAVLNNNSK